MTAHTQGTTHSSDESTDRCTPAETAPPNTANELAGQPTQPEPEARPSQVTHTHIYICTSAYIHTFIYLFIYQAGKMS